jgi:hypothetical protein
MYDWKNKPVSLAIKSKLRTELVEAGFKTVGDLVDADPADIAAKVHNIGLKRAENIRNAALASALADVLEKKPKQRKVRQPRKPSNPFVLQLPKEQQKQSEPIIIQMPQEPFSYVKFAATVLVTAAIVFSVSFLIEAIV